MLLHGRRRANRAKFLDLGGYMHRLHVLDARDAFIRAPAQQGASGLGVSRAGVFVADIDREEFEEAPSGLFPGTGNEHGQRRFRAMHYDGGLAHLKLSGCGKSSWPPYMP
jgi:hypothetical protein